MNARAEKRWGRGRWWLFALAIAAAVAYWWSVRQAAPAASRYRVALVSLTTVDDATQAGFLEALAELGYREEENLVLDRPGPAGQVERLDGLVARVLAASPDLILVSSTPASQAVQRATRASPVPAVFAPVNDPVGAGLVASLRAPGGNLTGVRLPTGDRWRLAWLRQIAPAARQVLVPYSPQDKSATESVAQLQQVAARLDFTLRTAPVEGAAALDALFADFPAGVDAVLLPRDSRVEAQTARFVQVCRERRLPLSVPGIAQVEAGGLYSYGFVHREIGRQAARLADQVLRGARPADLPVETAESYLAVNLGTAAGIGLPVPADVLRQATLVVRK